MLAIQKTSLLIIIVFGTLQLITTDPALGAQAAYLSDPAHSTEPTSNAQAANANPSILTSQSTDDNHSKSETSPESTTQPDSSKSEATVPNFDFFCSQLLQKKPSLTDYPALFTKEFRKAISLSDLKDVFFNLYVETGACTKFKVVESPKNKYVLTLSSQKNYEIQFAVSFDDTVKLFNGLLLNGVEDTKIQIKRWSDVGDSLQKLDPVGKLSATLTTPNKSVHLGYHDEDVFAIGSTLKLYVLGTLQTSIDQGLHKWDEILPLKEEWKSLPSGVMQDWPAGKKIKLYQYAEKMISISDNTATDHLLYFLGRTNVESLLEPMGNSHERDYLPFLSTLEMFKLKWAIKPDQTQKYIEMNVPKRREFLDTLKKVPRSQVETNGVDPHKPTLIDKLEWFATTPENCAAMFWLASQDKPEIRAILSKNVPVLENVGSTTSHWSYVGYKGGSESGVKSMTFLLESKSHNRACFAISWNNQKHNLTKYSFFDLVKKTLTFAETQIR
jgi:hypothetical protein